MRHVAILGFTGSQYGVTDRQRKVLREFVISFRPDVFHHGMCVGADEYAHGVVRALFPRCVIHGHPCTITGKRATVVVDVVHPVLPPLDRNRVIVRSSDVMVACPKEMVEVLRSGTWATIRYSRAHQKQLNVILPYCKI